MKLKYFFPFEIISSLFSLRSRSFSVRNYDFRNSRCTVAFKGYKHGPASRSRIHFCQYRTVDYFRHNRCIFRSLRKDSTACTSPFSMILCFENRCLLSTNRSSEFGIQYLVRKHQSNIRFCYNWKFRDYRKFPRRIYQRNFSMRSWRAISIGTKRKCCFEGTESKVGTHAPNELAELAGLSTADYLVLRNQVAGCSMLADKLWKLLEGKIELLHQIIVI
jgi:hypothetical protein